MNTLKYHLNNLLNQLLWAFFLLFFFVFVVGGVLILISGAKLDFSAIDSSTNSVSLFPVWMGLAVLSYIMVLMRSRVKVEIPNQNLEAFTPTFLSIFKMYRVSENSSEKTILKPKFPAVLAPQITLQKTNAGVEVILPRLSATQLSKKLKTPLNPTPLYIPSLFSLFLKFIIVGFISLSLLIGWALLSKPNREAMRRGAIQRVESDCQIATQNSLGIQQPSENKQAIQSYCTCYANEVVRQISLSELISFRFKPISEIENHPKIQAAITKCSK